MAKETYEYKKLKEFIGKQPEGAVLFYEDVGKELNLDMDVPINRQRLQRAIINSKRRYLLDPENGYILDEVDNAALIVQKDARRAYNAIVKSQETEIIMRGRYFERLSEREQQYLNGVQFVHNRILAERTTSVKKVTTIRTVQSIPPPNIEDRK